MFFCPLNLKLRLFVVFAAMAVVPGVGAQQPIIFSRPAGEVAEKANSFMPSPSQLRGAAGAFNAPSPLFGIGQSAGSYDVLPGSRAPVAVSPEEAKRWQKVLETRKNWTLMTPEENLGILTPEKILGITDPNHNEKLTPAERFLMRQGHGVSDSATNGRSSMAWLREDSSDNPFRSPGGNDRQSSLGDKAERGSARNINQFLNGSPNTPFGVDPKAESPWTSPFNRPAPVAKPDLAQEAAMERFRALMEPSSPPDKVPTAARVAAVPAPDPNMQVLPAFNPAGRSFTPIQSGISRPTGLMPLPGITRPYSLPATTKPAGKPQPPPWLSDSPRPFSTPLQRQF